MDSIHISKTRLLYFLLVNTSLIGLPYSSMFPSELTFTTHIDLCISSYYNSKNNNWEIQLPHTVSYYCVSEKRQLQ